MALKIALFSTQVLPTPPPQYGGLEKVVAYLAEELAKQGHEVTLFAGHGSRPIPGVKTVTPPEMMTEEQAWNYYTNVLNVDWTQFDVIHDHSWDMTPYLAPESVPVVHTFHGMGAGFDPRSGLPRKHMNLVGISFDHSTSLQGQTGLQVRTVYNGVRMEDFEFKLKHSDRLLYVGRIYEPKGPHVAIHAAVAAGRPIDIVGGSFGDNKVFIEHVKKMCDDSKGLATYHGEVSHKKLREFYQDADALVSPLLNQGVGADGRQWMWAEPFGLFVPEANLVGTPVITTTNGAMPELVKHGVNGLLTTSVEQLIEGVKDPWRRSTRRDIRKEGERFSAKAMAENYVALYKKAQKTPW